MLEYDKYAMVAYYCGTVLYYVFRSLYCRWAQVQTGPYRVCHAGPERPEGWDPTLGLINDLRAARI